MKKIAKDFEFKQCITIIKYTGEKAASLSELRKVIAAICDESIFHHIYQYFLKGHILEYTNDFAHWIAQALEERALAEHLSNLDPYEFKNMNDLRQELLKIIDSYLEVFPEPRETLPGNEFYFNESITFIYPAGTKAKNLAEFLIAMRTLDPGAIYYHFYEARIRLGIDDFSKWIEDSLGKKELAEKIRSIDPFMHSIEEIRKHIIKAVEKDVQSDMEVEQE